ncbi:lamin tail domain-containing protein [bacterium]|nr:lamin tail domain-containing protein [bacterium]
MARKIAPFSLLLFLFLLLPNFSFASSDCQLLCGLVLQEVKPAGKTVSGHSGEWIELMNLGPEMVNLADFCLTSKKDHLEKVQQGEEEPKNCFPRFELSPGEIVVVAYSAEGFVQEENLDFELADLKDLSFEEKEAKLKENLGGYLFNLKDEEVPLLENFSVSRLYLGNSEGEIFLFSRLSREIVDSFRWEEKIEKGLSWQRAVWRADKEFLPFSPSPFTVLPETIQMEVQRDYNSLTFAFQRISCFAVKETFQLFSENKLIYEQDVSGADSLIVKGLEEGKDYLACVEARESERVLFRACQEVSTRKHYPSLFLSELYPAPNKGEEEFVELFNPHSFSVALSGWSLKDKSGGVFALEGEIPPLSYAVFAPSFALNNSGDEVFLFDPEGELKDRVSYLEAPKGLSWAKFDKWQWTRVKTPGKKNILMPEYLFLSLEEVLALKEKEKVQIKASVVVPPKFFARTYFFVGQGSKALKVFGRDLPNLGGCVWVKGVYYPERGLSLREIKPASGCAKLIFSSKAEPFHLFAGEIYLEKKRGSYWWEEKNLKIRAPFSLRQGKAKIKGIIWPARCYLTLYLVEPPEFESFGESSVNPEGSSQNISSEVKALSTVISAPPSFSLPQDYRAHLSSPPPLPKSSSFWPVLWLIFASLSFVLAKVMLFA